eukprot:3151954-Rhodomonas_salina.1
MPFLPPPPSNASPHQRPLSRALQQLPHRHSLARLTLTGVTGPSLPLPSHSAQLGCARSHSLAPFPSLVAVSFPRAVEGRLVPALLPLSLLAPGFLLSDLIAAR